MGPQEEKVTEVRETNTQVGDTNVQRQAVSTKQSVPGGVLAQRIVYYVGGVLVALLVVRFLLQLFGASQGSGFVDFIYSLSGFFIAPFYGIFGEPTYGASHFESSTLVAIIVYALVTIGIAKLFTLGNHPEATA